MDMEVENERARETIRQLSKLVDLRGLSTHIAMRTYGGRERGAEPWENTREYMQEQDNLANTDQVVALFESAGCENEIEAVLWLDKYDEFVP
jgi:hypothetical protein